VPVELEQVVGGGSSPASVAKTRRMNAWASQPGRMPARLLASGGINTVTPSASKASIWTWCQ
jgi:hypothetical protein